MMRWRASLSLLGLSLVFACTDETTPSSDDGSAGSGGTTTGGSNATGGALPSGGTTTGGNGASGGAIGGASGTGGASAAGTSGSNAGGVSGTGTSGSNAGGVSGTGTSGSNAGGVSGTGTSGSNAGGVSGATVNGGTGAGGGRGGTAGGATSGGTGGSAAAPFKGIANSPCNVRTALGVSWYYNWTQSGDTCAAGGEFVPMIWGHAGAEQTANGISSAVATFVSRGNKNVLAFNEPDNPSQSNVAVNTAISLWPSFDNAAVKVGSPGTAANATPGQAWFTNFMNQLNANASLRADFLAIHWYGWNAGSCNATASEFESYLRWAENFAGNRPIWITEWGCLNLSAPSTASVLAFFQGAVAMFARHPRVVRYAWYPWSTNCAVANTDGLLTELGQAYAAAPAFK